MGQELPTLAKTRASVHSPQEENTPQSNPTQKQEEKKEKKVTMQPSAHTFGASKGKHRPDKQKEPVLVTDALADVRAE